MLEFYCTHFFLLHTSLTAMRTAAPEALTQRPALGADPSDVRTYHRTAELCAMSEHTNIQHPANTQRQRNLTDGDMPCHPRRAGGVIVMTRREVLGACLTFHLRSCNATSPEASPNFLQPRPRETTRTWSFCCTSCHELRPPRLCDVRLKQ